MRGSIAFNQQKYADALTYYQKAQAAGFTNQDLPLQMVKAKVESGDVAGGAAQLGQLVDQEKAAGRTAPEAWNPNPFANPNRPKETPPRPRGWRRGRTGRDQAEPQFLMRHP